MGGLERRLERLEGQMEPPDRRQRAEVRAHMRAFLEEIAAARREGREPSPEALAVLKAIERRRSS